MTDLVAELSARAKELAPEDRARLAHEILLSLQDDDISTANLDPSWDAEIRKRVAEVEGGKARLIPGDEVLERARQLLR